MKALLDRPAEARAWLRVFAQDPATLPVALSGTAHWQAYYGDTEAALETLRRGYQRGSGAATAMALSLWHPGMREVRRLPGFKQFVRDIGLVDYWRQYGWGDHCKPTTGDDFECQ